MAYPFFIKVSKIIFIFSILLLKDLNIMEDMTTGIISS